jgi:FRG domain
MIAATSPQESPRITPPAAEVNTEGRVGGVIVWNRIRVEESRPLETIATKVSGSLVVFRGYSVPPSGGAANALLTGLDRMCIRIDGGSRTRAPSYERLVIREFRRRAHHYLPDMSLAENSLELLALMQHHGAPTRLLDWTYSLYVAAHFALTHASKSADADLAIWVIRPEWCRDASKAACGDQQEFDVLWKPVDSPDDDHRTGIALLSGRLPRSIWILNPFRLNERLTIQQGLFFAPGDVTETFPGNLSLLRSDGDSGSGLTCYIIPRSRSRDVAQSLYEMNVTETTLFPGLDGFARSLWTFPELRQGRA